MKLWVKLREMKARGFHFRRQAPIGRYIVAFVCFAQSLVIEVDGGQHNLAAGIKSDIGRDAFLKSQGFRILRFWNSDLDRNIGGVAETVSDILNNPHPDRLSPIDPPHKGEG